MNNSLTSKKSKTRGVVLPIVVVSMLVISMFSLLLLTFIAKSQATTKMTYSGVSKKLSYEKIYYDFAAGETFDDENIFIYKAYNLEDKHELDGKNIKLIMQKDGGTISFLAVYDFGLSQKLAYYPCSINLSLDEEDFGFEMLGYYFLPLE